MSISAWSVTGAGRPIGKGCLATRLISLTPEPGTASIPGSVRRHDRWAIPGCLPSYSLLSARPGTITPFGDYTARVNYDVVEEFCQPRELAGRMAVFESKHPLSMSEQVARIAKYSIIPD